jgi:hypothetical protein
MKVKEGRRKIEDGRRKIEGGRMNEKLIERTSLIFILHPSSFILPIQI